ncbi:MAG: hypothetical protein EOO39_33755 [Cytophagaceae bacterium]|nr:MAG: hypothetical protein EOO39_33755 [Cytophagaceae bacterium]
MSYLLRSISLVALASIGAAANAVVFDFESAVYGSGYTSLSQTVGGLQLDLSRTSGATFEVNDISGNAGVPVSWGSHTLGNFNDGNFTSSYIGNFSMSVGGVSIDLGDFGADTDTLTLSLYSGLNGTGSLLGSATGTLVGGGFAFSNIVVGTSGPGAMSFVLSGDPMTSYPVSVYFDNIVYQQHL